VHQAAFPLHDLLPYIVSTDKYDYKHLSLFPTRFMFRYDLFVFRLEVGSKA